MADPTKVANLTGTLVLASSGSTGSGEAGAVELNLPIGTTVANSSALTSANVTLKSVPQSVIALVQMSSGTAVCTLDTTTDGTTPTFASAHKSQVTVNDGIPVFLGPISTSHGSATNSNGVITITTVTNVAAIKIQNNSGATLTLQKLRMLVLDQIGPKNWASDSRTADQYSASGEVGDGSGVFAVDT